MTDLNWPFLGGASLEIESASGVHLTTRDGRRILDAAGGAIVVNVGHGRRRVADRIAEAALTCSYVVPPWVTPSRRAMVEALEASWLEPAFTRLHFTSGGSEAVESAMKLALQYHAARGHGSRNQILSRSVSYHGTTVATTGVSGHAARRRGLEHGLARPPTIPTPDALRCPLGANHQDAGAYYAEAVREAIVEAGPENVAAFLAEPITGASGGAIVPPGDYWPRVSEICREFGVLLILDEVMTGFGRTGTNFAYQQWEILPDILIAGKGLAGGYAPLGGVFATEPVGAAIGAAGLQVMFHTFAAHPTACAAAAEVLGILVEEQLVARADRMGTMLRERLLDAFREHPNVSDVRGRGLLQAIEIVSDRATLTPFPMEAQITQRVVTEALERGVFFYAGGTGEIRDIVCLGPPFVIEERHVDEMVSVLRQSVDAVTR
jgi:adenosylmethionine-8-amino-7-oxononanoate aminotransferase